MANSWIQATAGTEPEEHADEANAPHPRMHAGYESAERQQDQQREAGRIVVHDTAYLRKEHQPHRDHERRPMQHLRQHELQAFRSAGFDTAPSRNHGDQAINRRQRYPVVIRRGAAEAREHDAAQRERQHRRVGQIPEQPVPGAERLRRTCRGVGHRASFDSLVSTTRDHRVAPRVMISSLKS